MILKGKVTAGLGEAKNWIKKIKNIFREKTGMDLYEGTLNINIGKQVFIDNAVFTIKPEEYGGDHIILVKECDFLGNKSYILRTIENNQGIGTQDINVIEIVSNINFRKQYNLKNDEIVNIIIK